MTDLSFHIRQFVPECTDPVEMEARQALLKARDYAAMLRSRTEGQLALSHATDAHEAASAFVFADVPTDRLRIAVSYCRNMVQAAFLADHLEREAQSEF